VLRLGDDAKVREPAPQLIEADDAIYVCQHSIESDGQLAGEGGRFGGG